MTLLFFFVVMWPILCCGINIWSYTLAPLHFSINKAKVLEISESSTISTGLFFVREHFSINTWNVYPTTKDKLTYELLEQLQKVHWTILLGSWLVNLQLWALQIHDKVKTSTGYIISYASAFFFLYTTKLLYSNLTLRTGLVLLPPVLPLPLFDSTSRTLSPFQNREKRRRIIRWWHGAGTGFRRTFHEWFHHKFPLISIPRARHCLWTELGGVLRNLGFKPEEFRVLG